LEKLSIRLQPINRVLEVARGTPLKDVLHGTGVEFPCGGRGDCGKCAVSILEGEVTTTSLGRGRLTDERAGADRILACQSICKTDLVIRVEQFLVVIQGDHTPFPFEPGKGLGIAVDLGTTTLVAQLVDLESGTILAVESSLNPQTAFGHDVIARLEAATVKGTAVLSDLIRAHIGDMLTRLTEGHSERVTRTVLVGNTVMQHLFNGSDINPLSFYPFESPDLGGRSFLPQELGWDLDCEQVVFCPSIGSFVGSDLLAAIMATGMHTTEDYSLLIDLGTNGEVAAGNREQLVCASTAAGPAFEGARISSGMLASTGAIASVESVSGVPSFSVIGNVKPRGICGSGLIDAVGVLLMEGMLGQFGEILSGEPRIPLSPGVDLTARDIQEFMLAKAAIAAGTEILLKKLGIDRDRISRVFVAGAFGNYLDVFHAERTGLLEFPAEKIHRVGNAAIMGARMFLFAGPSAAAEVLRVTRHVNLESDPSFQETYVRHMQFRTD